MARRVALVTGASRGIGRAVAVALAGAGLDVACTARTVRPGTGRDESDGGDGGTLPGSLVETVAAVEAAGATALAVPSDLTDLASLDDLADAVVGRFGRVDVLVNNAIGAGPGAMVPLLELTTDQLRAKLEANVVAQLHLTQAVVRTMLAAGGGLVVNVTSHVATHDPPAPVGQGGWGYGYAASKAAFHRLCGFLVTELGDRGISAVNVDPGFVRTERQAAHAAASGLGAYRGAPPSAIGAAVAWLVTAPEAPALWGTTVGAQRLVLERGLHPDWRTT